MPAAVLGEQPLQLTGTLSVLHASTSLLRQPTTKKPPMGLTAKSRVFRSTAAWVSMVSQSDRHVSEASGSSWHKRGGATAATTGAAKPATAVR
jgi:hypothetical protein